MVEMIKTILVQYGVSINKLLTSNQIDIALYGQDDVDRQNTYLYGVNEQACKSSTELKSPITVNNNCM